MKVKQIQVIVFKDVKGLCFMKCPVCKTEICIRDEDWSKCKHARNMKHSKRKVVYRLKKDYRIKEGFSKVIEMEVKNYSKYYGIKSMEDELNESR